MKTWGIVGLGWLGLELQHELKTRGFEVWGTHRSDFDFAVDPLPTRACDVLFLNTPPLTGLDPSAYVAKVATTRAARVVFVSSTSVYGDAGPATEASPPRPSRAGGRWLVAVEEGLRAALGPRLTVVRPGGLIGGERHPAFALARPGARLDDGPVNLVHRDDLIRIVRAAVERGVPLVNAVAPHHPLKSVYYVEWARRLGLPAPAVDPAKRSDRVIDSDVLPGLGIEWTCAELDHL